MAADGERTQELLKKLEAKQEELNAALALLEKRMLRVESQKPQTRRKSLSSQSLQEGHKYAIKKCSFLKLHQCADLKTEGIQTKEDLINHLKWALKIEFTTIPAYLFAMYSIKKGDLGRRVLKQVVMEEMLHVAQVSNLLVAFGQEPKFYDDHMIPKYPSLLPHQTQGLVVQLKRATKAHVQSFAAIEQPAPFGAHSSCYDTIGQFYKAISDGIKYLGSKDENHLFSDNSTSKQLPPGYAYTPMHGDSGDLMIVNDAKSALEAIDIIVQQGEGIEGSKFEDKCGDSLAHFFLFEKFANEYEEHIQELWPIVSNPTENHFIMTPKLWIVSRLFNASFCYQLLVMEKLWTVTTEEKKREYSQAMIDIMVNVLGPCAQLLVSSVLYKKKHAAPQFHYYNFPQDQTPLDHLKKLASKAVGSFEVLKGAQDTIKTLPHFVVEYEYVHVDED